MFSSSLVVLALAASSYASIFTTAPVANTNWAAGAPVKITWQEGSEAPSLAQYGQTKISIYAGNVQQQTSLQEVGTVDVSTATSIDFTPNASIGPSGSEYFVRFESLALKDPTNAAFPALAFSAKFTLTGMTGAFSADVLSQIAGQSTAGAIGGAATTAATTAAGSTTSSPASTTSKVTSTSAASKGSSAAPSASGTAGNGAMSASASFVLVGAAFLGLVALL